jgi:DNA (cytosine-5)-methyltransferase 1
MITTGHLCSGYDGIGRGLALLKPHTTLWHAEIDPDMSSVLAKHEPDVRNVGDLIALVLGDLWRFAPVPDILTAGFPCQPVSGAGRQLAELDPRWLWPFIIEIIRTVAPPFLMLENVQNIVSIQGGAIHRGILSDLRAAGYAARWTVLGACAVGAPHHRHRWYLWAERVGDGAPEAVRVGKKAYCGAPAGGGRLLLATPKASDHRGPGTARIERGEAPWHDLPTMAAMLPTPAARDGGGRGTPSREHAQRRADDPNRSVNLEDAVALLPTPLARDATPRGEGTAEYWADRGKAMPLGAAACLLPTPTASGYGNNQGGGSGRVGPVRHSLETIAPNPELWGKYAEAVALWEMIIGRPAPEPTEPNSIGGRRMSAALPEWMMGLPDGLLTGHLPRSAAIKGAGNGVVPLQAAAAQMLLA